MDEKSLLAERIERAALIDWYQAVPLATRTQLGWRLETVGTALVSIAEQEPSILLNRVIGQGCYICSFQRIARRPRVNQETAPRASFLKRQWSGSICSCVFFLAACRTFSARH